MENEIVTPEVDLNEVVQTAVREAMGDQEKNRRDMEQSILDKLVPEVNVGDDIVPKWQRDVALFVNASVAHATGYPSRGFELEKEYKKSRQEMTEAQKRYENQEAIRIIKESGLKRAQAQRAQSTLTGEAGGHLLPKPFLAEIFVRVEDYGLARQLFRGIPMGSKDLDLKSLTQKPIVYWGAELAPIQKTELKFAEEKLVAKKLSALLPWSNELEEDNVFGLVSFATEMFAEAIANAEDSAGFLGAGTGDTSNGEFTGVFNLTGNKVRTITANNFSGVTFDDISIGRHLLTRNAQRNAVFVMGYSMQGVLERIKDKDERPIYRFPQDGMPATLYGAPVFYSDALPGVGDEYQDDTPFMAYGNFANMLFGTRANVRFDISREGVIAGADDKVILSAFQQDAAIARVTERIGFASPLASSFVVWKTSEES